MTYKKFSIFIISVLSLFILFNFFIWHIYTQNILVQKDEYVSGDLARMGYLSPYIDKRKSFVDLTKKHHIIPQHHIFYDLITIGDSFSQGGGWGKNRFYQDYFASINDLEVLNLQQYPLTRNYLETVSLLLNSGFFDKYKTKYLLLESTQRKVVGRFVSEVDYTKNTHLQEIEDVYSKQTHDKFSLPDISFINDGNFKYVAYNLLYPFSSRAFISKVHKVSLKKEFFSIKNGKTLLYYHQDLKSIKDSNPQALALVNDNLNKLASILQTKNIQLIFMPAVSKYDLYSKYIVDNKYPQDKFFDIFRTMKKDYIFIDTKEILSQELEKGEKDIFYIDDTHWSYKASHAIAKYLKDYQSLGK